MAAEHAGSAPVHAGRRSGRWSGAHAPVGRRFRPVPPARAAAARQPVHDGHGARFHARHALGQRPPVAGRLWRCLMAPHAPAGRRRGRAPLARRKPHALCGRRRRIGLRGRGAAGAKHLAGPPGRRLAVQPAVARLRECGAGLQTGRLQPRSVQPAGYARLQARARPQLRSRRAPEHAARAGQLCHLPHPHARRAAVHQRNRPAGAAQRRPRPLQRRGSTGAMGAVAALAAGRGRLRQSRHLHRLLRRRLHRLRGQARAPHAPRRAERHPHGPLPGGPPCVAPANCRALRGRALV